MSRLSNRSQIEDLPMIKQESRTASKRSRNQYSKQTYRTAVISIDDCVAVETGLKYSSMAASDLLKLPEIDQISNNSNGKEMQSSPLKPRSLLQTPQKKLENKGGFLAVLEANAAEAQGRSLSANRANEKLSFAQQAPMYNKRSVSSPAVDAVNQVSQTTQSTSQNSEQRMRTPNTVKGALTQYILNKVQQQKEKHENWAKDVLTQEVCSKSKAVKVSDRAKRELIITGSFLEEDKEDTVTAVKAGIVHLNKTCDERLKEFNEQQKREIEKHGRLNAIRSRREKIGQTRTMDFGKINAQKDLKVRAISNKPAAVLQTWNPYVKKADRGGSVDYQKPNRSAPFKPLAAQVISKNKPTANAQQKVMVKAKQYKDAIQARKAIYNAMFSSNKNDEYGSEGSEYDSEY